MAARWCFRNTADEGKVCVGYEVFLEGDTAVLAVAPSVGAAGDLHKVACIDGSEIDLKLVELAASNLMAAQEVDEDVLVLAVKPEKEPSKRALLALYFAGGDSAVSSGEGIDAQRVSTRQQAPSAAPAAAQMPAGAPDQPAWSGGMGISWPASMGGLYGAASSWGPAASGARPRRSEQRVQFGNGRNREDEEDLDEDDDEEDFGYGREAPRAPQGSLLRLAPSVRYSTEESRTTAAPPQYFDMASAMADQSLGFGAGPAPRAFASPVPNGAPAPTSGAGAKGLRTAPPPLGAGGPSPGRGAGSPPAPAGPVPAPPAFGGAWGPQQQQMYFMMQQQAQQQEMHHAMLQAMDRVGQRGGGTGSDSENEIEGGSSSRQQRGFSGVQRLRRRYEKFPEKQSQAYLDKVMQELGIVNSAQPWLCTDFSRRVLPTFGKMRGLWRTHHGISEALQHAIEGRSAHCVAHLCALLQAIHQAAIDHGDWQVAALLVPTADPLARSQFGAGERELVDVHAYRQAMQQLQQRHAKTGHQGDEETPADPEKPGKGGGKKKRGE